MLKKAATIFKWIILGITVAHIITYFMPMYKSNYNSPYSAPETALGYLYGVGSSSLIVSFTILLIPIVALVFLFANLKNGKLFFFGFSATYILNGTFTILSLSKVISHNNNANSYYEYSLKYGYYFYIVTMAILAAAIVSLFVLYVILNYKEAKLNSDPIQSSVQPSKIDLFRKRIELLDDLKNQGVLTESEYEQKRSEIIKDFKI